jgi:hypothetical protein
MIPIVAIPLTDKAAVAKNMKIIISSAFNMVSPKEKAARRVTQRTASIVYLVNLTDPYNQWLVF